MDFYVHIDASNVAVGAMLAQNFSRKCGQPICYAFRLLNFAKYKYTMTEREALAMVYALKKYIHYLLGNPSIFFVDCIAMVYLVNKPQVSGRIARWFLLFLEYDFIVVYKPNKIQGVADALSKSLHSKPTTCVEDQLANAAFFAI